MLPARDSELVQIVDRSLADAFRRALKPDGSSWLACQPGCTSCCHGVFRITMLDAERLRAAMQELFASAPSRADAVRARAKHLARELAPLFPGDARTGILVPEEDSAWDVFADLPETEGACPALDPATGRCDLYAGRPLTCRVFGPPVQNAEGIGMCELCYVGAQEVEVLAGEMHLQHQALEDDLTHALPPGETIIAWAFLPVAE